ncbi:MAG: hypothetical protein M1832_003871 [Thelocarpon impressellum]|nr:MAG: hypothetical protein M1832_003871 [Thelocarpon impressellum]
MEMLLRQIDAPSSRITIIALRPIWEFAVLWSEYLLNQANPRFNVTDEYREVMRRATSSNSSTWATSPENVRASLLAFKQTRIVMFQGDATEEEHGSFTNIGRFFDTQIQDSRTTTDTPGNVRLLEEAFVNWPVQFLLVDRRSMLSNERPQKQHMFDGTVQPRFFELFPYTWIDKWPKKLVVQWAHLEAHRATFIRADDLLLPFVLGSKTNLVRESFRKVRYQGRDRATGRHSWAEAGEFSDSTVWFTNTSSSARDATSNADDREVRLQRELGSLYEKAFQRFVFP